MSIWSSFCTFGDMGPDDGHTDIPYTDFANEEWVLAHGLDALPRGCWLGFAQTWREVPFFRVSTEDENGNLGTFYLDIDQLRKLHDGIGEVLASRPSGGAEPGAR